MTVPKCILTDMMKTRTTIYLRTIEVQSVQKLKNNEARPKFTGFYILKKWVERTGYETRPVSLLYVFVLSFLCSLALTVRKTQKVFKCK